MPKSLTDHEWSTIDLSVEGGLREYLKFSVAARRRLMPEQVAINGYCGFEDFVLRNGQSWPYRRTKHTGRPKECFRNAFLLAEQHPDQFVYAEGYAVLVLLPVHHAWCVDRETGFVVDPTWRVGHRTPFYFGVPVKRQFLRKIILATEVWTGAIDVPQLRFPIITTPRKRWYDSRTISQPHL